MDFETSANIIRQRIKALLAEKGVDAIICTCNANLYYLYGAVVNGFYYIPSDGPDLLFIRRPTGINGDDVIYISKPEQIPIMLTERGLPLPKRLALEDDDISAAEWMRLSKIFAGCETVTGHNIPNAARMIKTEYELSLLRYSARRHAQLYGLIPGLYVPGMTDTDFSAEIEHMARKLGHIGVFRQRGFRMECFMGIVLTGDNAHAPSPYDFALGGSGVDGALPIGGSGMALRPGASVMVDISGSFTGYMSDCSRTFSVGRLPDEAYFAHNVSIEIQARIVEYAKLGTPCGELYKLAIDIAAKNGLDKYFMGYEQQAKFVGHGLGIEVNEPPVLAARDITPLCEGMVIAIEPKFTLPGIGAVGTENTYIMGKTGLECITGADSRIIDLTE